MQKLRIQGSKNPLQGQVRISGAKNAALPILCACLLTEEPIVLHNVPRLNDINTSLNVLSQLGVQVEWLGEHTVRLQADKVHSLEAPYELVKTMRASILVLGPLLTRFGQAKVSLPGGCAIGQRPVDQHIKGLEILGADIEIEHGFVVAHAKEGLQGGTIQTNCVTVGGTEQFLMSATLAKGTTVLSNAAREPEVVNLVHLLRAMGAKIQGEGTDRVSIEGVERLHGCEFHVMPDRIEAGTFLCAVAMTGGDITLTHVDPSSMTAVLDKLSEAGLQYDVFSKEGVACIRAQMFTRPKAVGFQTSEHPGFPTDMQAQMMTVNTVAQGSAMMVENIFENRFMHVPELNRLGADLQINGQTVVSQGVSQLSGANVMATDLRASASLVIAGLVAEGETIVDRIYHLDRGYEKMEDKLSLLGAKIERIS